MKRNRLQHVAVSFLNIRLLQTGRILNEIGIIRILILLVFGLPLLAIMANLFFAVPWLAVGFVIFSIASLQLHRKDRQFLKTYFSPYAKAIYHIEYQVLGLPALLLLLVAKHPLHAGVLVVGLSLIPYLDIQFSGFRSGFRRLHFLPATAFEQKSGPRESYLMLLCLMFLGALLAKLIYVPLIGIFLLNIVLVTNQIICETNLMINVFSWSPRKFLMHKFQHQLTLALVLCLPMNISFLLFHGSHWYILLAVNIIGIVIQCLAICFKYAFYTPGTTLTGNKLLLGLAAGCFLIVFLAPIPFVMLVSYYIKAQKNLKRYLYVSH